MVYLSKEKKNKLYKSVERTRAKVGVDLESFGKPYTTRSGSSDIMIDNEEYVMMIMMIVIVRRYKKKKYVSGEVYIRPTSRRFSCTTMELIADMTKVICFVSVAQVKWV